MEILLFGDQAVDYRSFLTKLLLVQDSPLLWKFLQHTQDVLRHEISELPAEYRKRLPDFSTVQELVERYFKTGFQDASIESALMCITQFAHFICFYEREPQGYVRTDNAQIVGVCAGLLTASAVASCESLPALIPLAIEVVRIAFRLGARVSSNAYRLEETALAQKSWSKVIGGANHLAIKAAIEEFNKTQLSSNLNRVYISSTASNSMTTSGPPSMLQRLLANPNFPKGTSQRDLPIFGPYHASHLYFDSGDIIVEDTMMVMNNYSPVHQVCGLKAIESPTVLELFEQSIIQILSEPIYWQETIDTCSSSIRELAPASCRILSMGPTTLANGLASSLKALGNDIVLKLEDPVSWMSSNEARSQKNLPGCNIAIVGMSGRFPDAANLELFWELLEKGLDVHREIPPDRFDAKAHIDVSGKGKNKSHTPYGCFIENPGLFDPRFFNMSPREAAQTDPMQRLAITTAYEAMESSGFVVNRTPSSMAHRVGTFYGQTSDDWREINAAQDIDTYFITGGVRAFGPGRVNYHFGFSGPSFNVDTACSSSFAAIQLACTSLRANECDTAFTGGMNVLTNPDIFSGLSKGQFLSPTGSCKTYDSNADGYCRGDGVVTLILKRVEDAITDKDPILGVIRGTATNHSAEAVSITHPHVGAQQFLFQKIVDDVGIDARDISYVEMHGTGTQAGDGVEMESVSSVFAPRERRRSNKPLFVGSAKANIGHGEAASGACALVKVLLMLQKDTIPPHCGIKGTINPGFPKDLAERGVHIAFEPTKFPRPLGGTGKRYCFINNFSAAGGNTGMLLEDAPLSSVSGVDSRPAHVVLVSAKSLASFKKNIRQLLSWTERHPEVSMGSLAYTTTARRYHYNYRIAFVASDMDRLRSLLSDSADASRVPVPSTPPKVAFTFTGQGSQYSGMAKALYEDSPYFRQCIESLCNLAYSQGFPSASILGLVNGSVKDVKSESPVSVQLAITIVQIALARFWQSLGVTPSVVIGHSLGEYAALHIAGVLSASDTISAVGKRAQLLVSCCTSNTHGMLAVRCHVSRIEDLVGKLPVEIACINAPEETVLSGETDVINELDKVLANKGIRCTKLNTPFAFHSSQVSPILESFKEATRTVVFHSPKLPIISPLLSEVIRPGGPSTITPEYLASHCRGTVNFVGSLNTALLEGVIDENMVWVEVGPHPHCLNMIKAVINSEQAITAVPSLVRNENAWKTVSNSLATLYTSGLNLEWPEYFKGFEDAVEVLPIPTYSFDEKVYWLEYKNNWTLTKGETAPLLPPPVKPSFSTTSVQKIIKEEINGNSVVVVAETDLCEPLIAAAIAGHLLNGVPFCPSTLFADMAFTLCEYAYKLIRPNEEGDKKGYNVCNMESHKAVILDPNAKSQILQISITFDLDKGMAQFQYKTKLSSSKLVENGHSIIKIEDKEQWLEENKRRAYLVRSRIASLKTDRGVHTIHRGMAYKLFTALVNYDNKYRAMEEVLLDSHNLEATARIVFQTSEKDGNFIMNPYHLDPACHISGFIVNATDAIDSSTQVYISHGWESMRFTKKLETHKTYRSYVKMAQISSASKVVSGDVYVFEGEGDEDDELIGVVGGLKFQCVPRRLLDILVGSDSSSASARPSPKAPAITSSKVSKPAKHQTSKIDGPDRGLAENKDQDMTSDSDSTHTPTGPSSVSSVESGDDEPAKSNEDATIATIRSTIANEMGVDIDEISDTVDLSTMGMDSLMSLAILGILREQTGLKLGSEFLLENPSMADIKKSLGLEKPRPAPKSTTIATAPEVKKSNGSGMDSLSSYPPAQSLLLQGNPRTASRNLFLLPDGSGSATSYAGIPDLDVETAVFGLNCPFMKTPELFTIEIQHITKIYIAAIKKRQPHGPYILGGWSAGGVLAYEMTRQLIAQGDVVSKLILIDSPNPIKLEALPPSFHQFCDRIGLLGDGSSTSPSWLIPHFRAIVNKLTSYSEWLEREIDTAGFPVTTTIWARDGIVQGDNREQLDWDERVPMPNSMFWLCNGRKDLGHNGWEKLVGKGKVRCVSMKGNHFTMMREPLIKEVARLVKEAMDVE